VQGRQRTFSRAGERRHTETVSEACACPLAYVRIAPRFLASPGRAHAGIFDTAFARLDVSKIPRYFSGHKNSFCTAERNTCKPPASKWLVHWTIFSIGSATWPCKAGEHPLVPSRIYAVTHRNWVNPSVALFTLEQLVLCKAVMASLLRPRSLAASTWGWRSDGAMDASKKSLMDKFAVMQISHDAPFVRALTDHDCPASTAAIHQQRYTEEKLEQSAIADAKPVTTQAIPDIGLSRLQAGDELLSSDMPHAQLVGNLMFLEGRTRSDSIQPVSALARYMLEPRQSRWQATKHLLRYVRGTTPLGLRTCGHS
jgi:hypothetical protein